MSSIATAVFKLTVGMLVSKVRDKAAERLKDGDVTDRIFRDLIVREIDDVKSKLDGLSRKDLLSSISFFKEGIELLYQVFDKARITSDMKTCHEAVSFVKGMKKLELTSLDESATRLLSDAKERFKDARRRATDAFANEALKTADRILAMQYRVLSTILEKIDNPADAVAPCKVCVEDLHGLSAVQEYFNVELTKGFRARFEKDERRKIIADICHVNFVIYSTTLMVGSGNKELSNWPCVIMGEEKVDPLHDERVAEVLRKQGMEHCSCVTPWSFGQEGEEEHKLKNPRGIATNSSGQFIVVEINEVKMFDPTGQCIQHFSLPNDDAETELFIWDVATDNKDNIYVLVKCKKTGSEGFVVYEFSNTADLHHKFPVRGGGWVGVLTVTNSKVLVLSGFSVAVYDTDGLYVRSFGEGTLQFARDITAANDSRVMVLDWIGDDDCRVHIFSEDGDYLDRFKLQGRYDLLRFPRIAFHQLTESVVIAEKEGLVEVEIFTKDGEFVRSTPIHEERIDCIAGMTVAKDGRIAVLLRDIDQKNKVLVI